MAKGEGEGEVEVEGEGEGEGERGRAARPAFASDRSAETCRQLAAACHRAPDPI